MKKNILNKKFTFLTAAALTAVSASLVANQNTAKAAELTNNNDTNNQNSSTVDTTQTSRVTDKDVANAQTDVDNAQNQVNDAKRDVQNAQQNVNNAQTDLQNTEANKPAVDQSQETQIGQAVEQAQQDVNQKQDAVDQAQKQITNANAQVTQKQTEAANAQTQADQAKQNAQKADQIAQSAQEDANKAQSVADQDKTVNTSKLTASDSYKNAVKKYNDDYVNQVKKGMQDDSQEEIDEARQKGMHEADFNSTMQKASDESYNLKSNNFVHNEYDQNRKVNINHLTKDEQRELSDYAAGLMNDMNKQVGLPSVEVNDDVQQMANDIAQGYNEDNRTLFDGKSHDYNRINQVAKDYGLNSLTGDSQYYEDAAGWIIGGRHIDGNNSDENGWYANNSNPGETNMDEIKEGIYNSLKIMYFNHQEWYHAFGMLKAANYNRNYYLDRTVTYHFAYAPSALPDSNNVTDHFIIVADDDEQANSKISNANDHSVADLDSAIARVTKDQTALKVAKLNLDKANEQKKSFDEAYTNAQTALETATKQVQNAQRIARVAQANLTKAQADLTQSKENLQHQLDLQKQAKDNYTASQKKLAEYQEAVAQKQNVLAQAKKTLADKQTALTKAEQNLLDKQTKLAQIKAIKSAQDLADQTAKENAKHNQDKGKTETTKPADKPDQGKTTDPTKPADKPDQGKTTDTTKPADKPDQGKTTDTTKPADKPDQGQTTDPTKPADKPDQGKTTDNTKPDQGKTTDTTKPAGKPDQGKTTDNTKPVDKPDQGKTTDTTKPVDKPDQGKTTDTTKPVDKPDQGKTTDNTDVLTPVDDLADTSTVSAVDDLVSAPVVRVSKLTAVKSANGQFILVNANGESIARQFVNIHDLIQYLLRNYKGEIAINNLVSLSKNANAYILDENGFNQSGVTLPSGMKCIITAIRVQNGKAYARIANSQYWIDADIIA